MKFRVSSLKVELCAKYFEMREGDKRPIIKMAILDNFFLNYELFCFLCRKLKFFYYKFSINALTVTIPSCTVDKISASEALTHVFESRVFPFFPAESILLI